MFFGDNISGKKFFTNENAAAGKIFFFDAFSPSLLEKQIYRCIFPKIICKMILLPLQKNEVPYERDLLGIERGALPR